MTRRRWGLRLSAELDERFLDAVRAHRPSERVRAQAEATGVDLGELRKSDPLTYGAINAAPLVRTDARLAPQVKLALEQITPYAQLFTVPLTSPQTDTELRVFPPLHKSELAALDDALGALVGRHAGGLFYRTVNERSGERRELAWPLLPATWQAGAAFVGPFADQAEANAWGQTHVDPRSGFVFDALPYAGAWYGDIFKGEG